MSPWQGKRVFVSGGSSGMGRALALQLAREGARVCIAARGAESLDATLAEMKAVAIPGAALLALSVDVTDAVAVEGAAAEAVAALGGIDLLLCVQGYAKTGRVHEMPAAQYKRLLEVNYLGHAHLCRAFTPHFIRQNSGQVVMVSSVLGYLGTYGYAAYSASKWAIVGFAEGLRQELALYQVPVQVMYPGTTDTRGLIEENADKPKVVWEIESNSPFNKTRSAEDVAARILKAAQGSRFENPIGWDGWLTFIMSRYFPGLVRMLNDSDLRAAIKKHGLN